MAQWTASLGRRPGTMCSPTATPSPTQALPYIARSSSFLLRSIASAPASLSWSCPQTHTPASRRPRARRAHDQISELSFPPLPLPLLSLPSLTLTLTPIFHGQEPAVLSIHSPRRTCVPQVIRPQNHLLRSSRHGRVAILSPNAVTWPLPLFGGRRVAGRLSASAESRTVAVSWLLAHTPFVSSRFLSLVRFNKFGLDAKILFIGLGR